MHYLRSILILSVVVIVGAVFVALRPAAEETDMIEPPEVSESELQTFIQVYCAMQMDHDLKIEKAIEPYSLTTERFRALERRIQAEQRLVDKVREALLAAAQSRSLFAKASTSTPSVVPATPTVAAR